MIEAIVLGRVRVLLTRSALLALGSWLAIASGASLGREGPLIQFGAAAGEGARRAFALDNVTARIGRALVRVRLARRAARVMLPLLVATGLAALWARRLYVDSVYTAELSRRGLRWRLTLDGRRVIESQQHSVDAV